MAAIVLFHSLLGLRNLELDAANRLRAGGHSVFTPDLFGGASRASYDAGFTLKDQIGWPLILERARQALTGLPEETVLAGFSFGAGVASALWPQRPLTAGVLFLHGIAGVPETARAGLPLQVHLADPDPFEPADEVAGWRQWVAKTPVVPEVFLYPGPGHLFTDPSLPGHDAEASALLWSRVSDFLANL